MFTKAFGKRSVSWLIFASILLTPLSAFPDFFSSSTTGGKVYAAEVISIEPQVLYPGESTVIIKGKGFGEHAGYVDFGGEEKITEGSEEFIGWQNDRITVLAPEDLPGGKLKIGIPKGDSFTIIMGPEYLVYPVITNISPRLALPDSEVTIEGAHFGSQIGHLRLDGKEIAATSWSENKVTFTFSGDFFLEEKAYAVTIASSDGESRPDYLTVALEHEVNAVIKPDSELSPEITKITPDPLVPGEGVLMLEGKDFGTQGTGSTLYYKGFDYEDVVSQVQYDEDGVLDPIEAKDFLVETDDIISWTNKKIVFRTPENIMNDGVCLKINSTGIEYCNVRYKIKPTIYDVRYDLGEVADAPMLIIGNGFGAKKGWVYVGKQPVAVEEWFDLFILASVPGNYSDTIMVVTEDGIMTEGPKLYIQSGIEADPLANYQWYLRSTKVDKAWRTFDGSRDVTVAILDDGIYVNHPELGDNLWRNEDEIAGNDKDDDKNGFVDDSHGWNFVEDNSNLLPNGMHGTAVAGIIGSVRDKEGTTGIAQEVKLMPVIISDEEGAARYEALSEAIKYAVDNGADIINLSYGGLGLTTDHTTSVDEAIAYAYEKGVLLVVSAGNADIVSGSVGTNLDVTQSSPVCNDVAGDRYSVLGVTAVDRYFWKPEWAAFGDCVDLAAPGTDILTTIIPDNELAPRYALLDGTSFAAPIVSGIAALLKGAHPDWKNVQIAEALIKTSINIDDFNTAHRQKIGRFPNAQAALSYEPKKGEPKSTGGADDANNNGADGKNTANGKNSTNAENTTPAEDSDKVVLSSEAAFKDVPQSYAYFPAVEFVYEKGIVQGYEDGTYRPDQPINRAEFMKIIMEAKQPGLSQGKNCFPDVKEEWFAKYVCFGNALGIIKGYGDGTFRPSQQINFVEALKIVLEAFEVEVATAGADAPWFEPYVRVAEQKGLSLYGKVANDKNISRGEMAEIIRWVMEMK